MSWISYLQLANPATAPQFIGDKVMAWFNPSLPASSSPVAQAPKAPITLNKMRTWSPDDLAEAEAQRGAQYQRDVAFFRANSTPTTSDWPSIPPPASQDQTGFWLLVGAGLIGAVIIARKI